MSGSCEENVRVFITPITSHGTRTHTYTTYRSRFQLPNFCHKFYNNNLTQTLARRKSTKEIWGNVFHPGTPEGNNKREHYFAKSEAGSGSRFDHYYKERENTKQSHDEGMKRTASKRHNYNEMPTRHKGSIHT
jgi:hypothetical protein